MKNFILIAATYCTLIIISGCGKNPEVESCVNRGIAYFKEIGSYPYLTSNLFKGKSAEAEARERCNRTTTAF